MSKREYDKIYYQKNKERIGSRTKQYREDNPEKTKKTMHDYHERNKEKFRESKGFHERKRWDRLVLTAQAGYGGECLFCGEDRPEALVFHHVDENGAEHRKEIGRNSRYLYQWVIENNFPSDIILLCANCHICLHRRKIGED